MSSGLLQSGGSSPLPAPRRIGPYEIVRELGRGSMGVVYLGRVPGVRRELAIKVIGASRLSNPTARERFRREAKLLARVRHPGVITVHDAGEDGGVLWYAMDVVKGRSLEEVVDAQKGLPHLAACRYLAVVARAVQAMHEHGIVHRDLKPANVMLEEPKQNPLLADFGLALDLEDENTRLTKTGHSVGTPTYMSPEQVRAVKALDARADVYGLGGVLYYALTGRDPFVCDTIEELVQAILERAPDPPSKWKKDIPRAVDRVVLKALAKDRDRRHASAAALAEDLELLANGEAPPPEPGVPRRRRIALATIAAGVGVPLLVAGPLWTAFAQRGVDAAEQERRAREALATELLEANRRKAQGFLVGARANVSEGDFEVGRKLADDGLRLAPNDPRLLATHARALIANDKHLGLVDADARLNRSRAEAERASRLAPNEPIALLALACVRFLDKEKESGNALLRRAVEPALGPDARAIGDAAELALFYVGPDARDFALEQIERALVKAPEWAHAWYVKGRALDVAHDGSSDAAADQALTRAVELDKDQWLARLLRGRVRDRMDKLPGAREDYAALLERFPDQGNIAFDLGFVEERLGHLDVALELYDRAVALARDGESWPMRQRRARIRRARGDVAGAAEDMRKVLAVAPMGQYALFLGECLLELGRTTDAREAFERAVVLDGSAEAILGVAACRERERGPRDALTYLEREVGHAKKEETRQKIRGRIAQLEDRLDGEDRAKRVAFLDGITARKNLEIGWLRGLTTEINACTAMVGFPQQSLWVQDIGQRIKLCEAHQKETERLEAAGQRK